MTFLSNHTKVYNWRRVIGYHRNAIVRRGTVLRHTSENDSSPLNETQGEEELSGGRFTPSGVERRGKPSKET